MAARVKRRIADTHDYYDGEATQLVDASKHRSREALESAYWRKLLSRRLGDDK